MGEIRIGLAPTDAQAELLEKTFSCCQFLWNRMIADEQKLQAELGRHFIPTPARYKRETPALKEVDSLALASLHQSLKKAFQDHQYNPHDYPRPETLASLNSYTTYCQQTRSGPTIWLDEGVLRLPKLGAVKARLHEPLPRGAAVRSAVVSRTASGYECRLFFETADQKLSA